MDRHVDTALIDRLRARDESAVADLASRYRSRIQQLAFRYTRNREDAEEVAQDVLLKIYQKIEAFRGDAALSSWIYRIAFNTVMSRLRARPQATRHVLTPEATTNVPDGSFVRSANPLVASANPVVASAFRRKAAERASSRDIADWSSLADDRIMRGELRRKLVEALRDLPLIYRAPVLLRDVHGLSTEEASAVLRVKEQTLKSRLHRGRTILRDRLSDFASGLRLHERRN
ncbi:MAG: sigma-70 family RNA polymerase sigma factor [Acidobacteria bacterium]|nr:sigma-70 family RNA polymerase sigma factor [Acidobacteriota bacterium]